MIAKAIAKMLRGTAAPILLAGVAVFLSMPAVADPLPPGSQTSNLDVVGFTGLNGRPGAFKLALKHTKDDKWYLYAGHSFDQGWSIVDVTEPKNPRYVKFIPYTTEAKGLLAAQVTLHDDLMITAIAKTPLVSTLHPPTILIWDI